MHLFRIGMATMPHSEQKCVHFCSESSIVGYGTGAFWDLWQNGVPTLLLKTWNRTLSLIYYVGCYGQNDNGHTFKPWHIVLIYRIISLRIEILGSRCHSITDRSSQSKSLLPDQVLQMSVWSVFAVSIITHRPWHLPQEYHFAIIEHDRKSKDYVYGRC